MPTSELSDALNPNFHQPRRASHVAQSEPSTSISQSPNLQNQTPRNAVVVQNNVFQQTLPPQFTPHRSELEDAMNPMAISQPTQPRPPPAPKPTRPPTEPLQILKNLVTVFAAHRDAVEVERQRRLAWEQEQEAKYQQRNEELESRLLAMQQEIENLKLTVGSVPLMTSMTGPLPMNMTEATVTPSDGAPGTMTDGWSSVPEQSPLLPNDYMSYTCRGVDQPEFVEGSSTMVTHDSPQPSAIQTRRKRPRLDSIGEKADANDSQAIAIVEERPQMKLRTRLDSRPQTIQAALRNHILRLMDLESDKHLPASHVDGVPLPDTEPVRFVWDKTTKKSDTNRKMKVRVVSDIVTNSKLYPLVPAQEFTKQALDPVFDQAFTTLRQKFRSQTEGAAGERTRESSKARRARRTSRKKAKLAKRVTTRKDFREYTIEQFDGAFQLECMSSEESSEEEDLSEGSSDEEKEPKQTFLRIRYLAWRSSRLHRLYQMLDEREELDRSQKPKRGIGRKDRRMGLPKDGNPLPPKGTARWMVSKKWLQQAHNKDPRIVKLVEGLFEGQPDVDWSQLSTLGDDSDVELQLADVQLIGSDHPQYDNQFFGDWPVGSYLDNLNNPI